MIKSGYTAEDLAKLGPDALTRKKLLAEALMADATKQRKIEHPLQGMAQMAEALMGGLRLRKLDAAEKFGKESADKDWGSLSKILGGGSSSGASMPSPEAAKELISTGSGPLPDMSGNDVYTGFMDTVRAGGVNNPYALAAIAATGKSESGFDPKNAVRTWSDPSESGQAGRAGGIMSWRGPRYEALAKTGDLSPQGQAKFFLQENPQLIQQLQNAKSVEEAQSLMNNAWKFAGYNRPGGEAGRRLGLAQGFLPSFQGGGDVAASSPEAAFDAVMPSGGASLSDEVAEFKQTPEYAAQFPGANREKLAGALVNGQGGQEAIAGQMPRQTQVAQALMGDGGSQRSGVDPALIQALSNPYLDPQRRAVAQTLLDQQIQQNDPLRQLQLQKGQLELDQLRNPREKTPESVQALDMRAQRAGLVPGTKEYNDFMISGGRQGTTINNMGNIPAGYQLTTDPQTGVQRMEPIPGSPAALEMEEKLKQKDLRQGNKETSGNVVVQDIDRIFRAMDNASLPTTGGVGNLLSGVPGTAALDVAKLVDTIKANATFDKLQAMREASPTGGALGAVSDTENKLLSSAIGSLDQSQSDEQFRDNLARVQNIYLDIIHGQGNGPERRQLRFENKPESGEGGLPKGMDPEVWQYLTPDERKLFQ